MWNGRRMIFGDGDTVLFERFTIAIDVIGHELTHGVTQYDNGLIYSDQSGALNESISDVFGSLIKQYNLNQTADQADWLIGQGLLVSGEALRSMKDPGAGFDPQPAHMRDYVDTIKDNGGVHINSGIPNYAFYLAAVGLGDYAWQRVGLVWYLTLPLTPPKAQFQDFAKLTLATAQELYGVNSTEYEAVGAAWAGVGISI
jgi:Zn-dependent metalloprotease